MQTISPCSLRYTEANIVLFPHLSGIYQYHALFKREFPIEIPEYARIILENYRNEGAAFIHSKEVEMIFFPTKSEDNKRLWVYLEKNMAELKCHIENDIIGENRKLWLFGNRALMIDLYAELSLEKFPNILFYKPEKVEVTKLCSLRTRYSKEYKTYIPLLRDIEQSVICKN